MIKSFTVILRVDQSFHKETVSVTASEAVSVLFQEIATRLENRQRLAMIRSGPTENLYAHSFRHGRLESRHFRYFHI